MLEDALGANQLSIGELDLTVPHRHTRLEEELPRSVVQHHDEHLGGRAQHGTLAIGVGGGDGGGHWGRGLLEGELRNESLKMLGSVRELLS